MYLFIFKAPTAKDDYIYTCIDPYIYIGLTRYTYIGPYIYSSLTIHVYVCIYMLKVPALKDARLLV